MSTSISVHFGQLQAPAAYKPRIPFDRCPLCSSDDIGVLRVADCSQHPLYHPAIAPRMTWMRCRQCEHVFTDGYFSSELEALIFAKTHEYQKPGWSFEQQRYVSARMVQRVAQHVAAGRWMDVGFGNGSLLFTAEEWGFTPVGLDLRASSVEAMRGLGIEAHCKDLADFDDGGTYAVISMADVLEHMPFPKVGLAAAHRLLEPGGILFLSMPHYQCAAWRLLDASDANPYWGELEHFHNFSRQRLSSLLQEHCFEPLSYGVSERYRVCMELVARRCD